MPLPDGAMDHPEEAVLNGTEAAGRLTGGSPSFGGAVLRNLTETWPDFRNSLFCDRLVALS